jgi:hypothetical protein
MALTGYLRGELVRVSVAFTNNAGAAGDPTTVTLKYRPPGGAIVPIVYPAAGIVKDSTGNYHADIDTSSAAGIWRYRWEGTSPVQSAAEAQFTVIDSALN